MSTGRVIGMCKGQKAGVKSLTIIGPIKEIEKFMRKPFEDVAKEGTVTIINQEQNSDFVSITFAAKR